MQKKINITRWLFSCLVLFSTSCQQEKKYNTSNISVKDSLKFEANVLETAIALKTVEKLIQSGDVITRTGNDFTSQSLRKLNRRDNHFSHAGIASIENDSIFVYHAVGGEYNPNQKLRREYFDLFSSPYENNALGIFRIQANKNTIQNIVQKAKSYMQQGLIFDLDFNLRTDDKMYCSEFVYKCFLIGSDNQVRFRHSFINDFEFIGIDDITMDSLTKKIAVYNYKLY